MDVRPQSHEIIRTWAFYTIAKAWLHEGQIPWRNVAISGWVLDPDRKKMSKSKGNVVTPMHLLDQYGADAVRYWSLSARLGTDTAFDEKVFAVGRRLVMKVWNAAKYALSQSAAEGPVSHPLDRSFLARLRETVEKATAAFDELDYAGALDTVERFFWSGYTDNYLEMVKARARSESDAAGRASAVAAVQQGLSVILRLLAPYLPYVTEEVWSWGFARATGTPSIHRAPWPSAAEFAERAVGCRGRSGLRRGVRVPRRRPQGEERLGRDGRAAARPAAGGREPADGGSPRPVPRRPRFGRARRGRRPRAPRRDGGRRLRGDRDRAGGEAAEAGGRLMDRAGALQAALAARGGPAPAGGRVAGVSRLDERSAQGPRARRRPGVDGGAGRRADGRPGARGPDVGLPSGGLYLSVLLRPRFARVGLLPLAAGVAVAEAAGELGVATELKWPNDVLASGRKLAGILAEAASGPAGVEWVVLGLGVNVALEASAVPPEIAGTVTSLAAEGAGPRPIPEVAAAVLARLGVCYDALRSNPGAIVSAWRSRAAPWWGGLVDVRTADGPLQGRLRDVDDEGALVIELEGGERRRFLSGEVDRVRPARCC